MKVYITGIAGFLGSHLAHSLLERGYVVAGCDNLSGGFLSNCPEKIDFASLDILDLEQLKTHMSGANLVIHTAALAHEGLSVFSPKLITENIYAGTISVASAAISAGATRILNCSSMARYGNIKPPFKETMVGNPVDPYGLAKYQAEQALNLLSDIHGITVQHIVPHNIIGIHQNFTDPYRNVASIFINSVLLSNKLIIYGDGSQKRSFSPVNDCIQAIIRIIEGNFPNKDVFNIGPQGNEISIKELANKVIRLTKATDTTVLYLPDRPREVKDAWCDSTKAIKQLGYNPNTSIDVTLADMVRWINQQGPQPFNYRLPVEIVNESTPQTWTKKIY